MLAEMDEEINNGQQVWEDSLVGSSDIDADVDWNLKTG